MDGSTNGQFSRFPRVSAYERVECTCLFSALMQVVYACSTDLWFFLAGEVTKQDGGRTLTTFWISLTKRNCTNERNLVSARNEFIELFRLCFEVPTIEYNFEIRHKLTLATSP